ncbi:MAG: hypothetical protein PHH82_00300 [Candidatus ainarchaeum sp.]|nr:hypothetical protein [Candidatus ainarchaeum sp.]
MLRKMYLCFLILLVGLSFSIGFVKPLDKDIDSGKIDAFASIMPGQVLDISFLKQYNGESIESITVKYNDSTFELGKINYGEPFIDVYITAKENASPGVYDVLFIFNTNQGEKTVTTSITISKNLVKGQLFFVGSSLKLHETKDIKYILENLSDSEVNCNLNSNLAESWIKYVNVSLGPKEIKEYSNQFVANNVGDYEIQFVCEDYKGDSLFKLGKQLTITADSAEENKFLYFSYPVINSVLNPFHALINYISDLFQ